MTLYQMFRCKVEVCADVPFVLTGSTDYTYGQASDCVQKLIGGLRALGVRRGERVAVCMANCPEYVFLTFALSALGAVKIPVNIELGPMERQTLLRHMDPSLIVIQQNDEIEVFPCQNGEKHGLSWHMISGLGAVNTELDETIDAEDICDIIYTSGSSGTPKGVMLSSDMLLRSAYANCLNRGFELGRRICVPLPFFHVYGYVEGLLSALLAEGTIILPCGHFQPEQVLHLMYRYQANDLLCVPGMMRKLLQSPALNDVSLESLHAVYCSASAYPSWLYQAIRERLGVDDIITGYGMTETAGATIQTVPGDNEAVVLRSVGRLLPGETAGSDAFGGALNEYRTVDPETGAVLPFGEAGELQCRGATVTTGYFNNAEANRSAFTLDGWLRTGDLGRFDENGYLELLGRCSSRYKCNGENVSPDYVAQVLEQCPLISHAEVIGIPDAKTGETGFAFLELVHDIQPEGAQEVIEGYCKTHLARFQIPSQYYFIGGSEWPLTAAGKICRRELRSIALHRPVT